MHSPRSAFILPPAVHGSLGDEAVLLALGQGYDRFWVGKRRQGDWPGYDGRPANASGGAGCSHVIAMGTDVFDGSYGPRPAERIASVLLGAPHAVRAVVGFSFRPDAGPQVRATIARLPADTRFVARDARSHARFVAFTGRTGAVLGADPAFLLRPDPAIDRSRPRITGWIRARKRESRRVVGLNISGLARGTEAGRVIKALAELPARFPDVAFVLLPHDIRPEHADQPMLAAAARSAPANTCMAVLRPAEVKAVCAQLDFVVTARMHVAIAALGAGTPAAVVESTFKVAGLLDHFEQPDLAIPAGDAGGVEAAFAMLLSDAGRRRERIAARLPPVMDLARRNWV